MDLIDNVSQAVIIIIRAGAIFRVAFCFFRLLTAEEEAAQYRKRIKHVLLFYVLAECAFLLKDLILAYYQ